MTSSDLIPWTDLDQSDRKAFAEMLNRRYGASVSIEEAKEYYGEREKVEQEFGPVDRNSQDAPECPECFSPLYKRDAEYLKRTGKCPNCDEVLIS